MSRISVKDGLDALSYVGEQIEDALVLFLTSSLAEHIPEAERLVSGSSNDGFAVGAQGEIQNAVRVASQLGNLSERRVLPYEDLVLRVAVSRHQLR